MSIRKIPTRSSVRYKNDVFQRRYNLSLVSALLLLSCLISVSCSGGDSKTKAHFLTFWSSNNSHEIQHAKEVVAKWNKLHPDWKVKHQPIPEGRSSEEVLLAAIVSKGTPDIYSNVWPGVIQQYIEASVLVRLDTFPDFDSVYVSRIPEPLRDQFRSMDGAVYQMPWKSNPIVLQYNKRLFNEVGVGVPLRTYSEFFSAAEKLTKDTDGDGHLDQWMMDVDINVEWWKRLFDFYTFFIAASGGKTLIEPGGGIAFDSRAGREAFDFVRNGFEKGFFPNEFFQGDIFLQERVAAHISGPWNIAQIEKFKPEGFEYGFMPIPVPDNYEGKSLTYGDPKNICIFSSSLHPGIAWKFVKFLVSKENDRRLLELTNQMPIRKDLVVDPIFRDYFDTNPRYRFFAEMVPNIVGVDQSIYLQEMFDIISQEFDAACVQRMKSTDEGIRDAAERCRSLVARERF